MIALLKTNKHTNSQKLTLLALFFLLLFIGHAKVTSAATVQPKAVGINVKTTINAKSIVKAKIVVSPKKATKAVKWSSGNKKIVKVTKYGNVYGLKPGKTYIKAITKNGKLYTKINITVKNVNVRGVKVAQAKPTVKIGSRVKLTPTFSPSNATVQTVTWKSLNTSLATVDKTGFVLGKKKGSVKIQVTSTDGKKVGTVTVNVLPVPVTGVAAWPDSKNLDVGEKMTLWEDVAPVNATNKKVVWKSSNPKVATTTKDGYVTAKASGKVKFTVTTEEKKLTQTIDIVVRTPIKTSDVLTLAKSYIGKPYEFGATGPDSFDCSGFTQFIFQKARGVNIGRTTWDQQVLSTKTSSKIAKVTKIKSSDIKAKCKPGDLIMFDTAYDHVGIYAGNYQMIHAPQPGMFVGYQDLQWMTPDFALQITWK